MCDLKDAMKDGKSIYDIEFPGNFSSDAEFFVFTGVVAWLYCFARFESTKLLLSWISSLEAVFSNNCSLYSLAVYVFFNHLYVDQQKNYPKVKTLAYIQFFFYL